jgi:hypothetical protein
MAQLTSGILTELYRSHLIKIGEGNKDKLNDAKIEIAKLLIQQAKKG